MQKQKLLFIGHGNMALAIIKGALNAQLNQKYDFEITGRNQERLKNFLKLHNLESHFKIIPAECGLDITDKIILLCIFLSVPVGGSGSCRTGGDMPVYPRGSMQAVQTCPAGASVSDRFIRMEKTIIMTRAAAEHIIPPRIPVYSATAPVM